MFRQGAGLVAIGLAVLALWGCGGAGGASGGGLTGGHDGSGAGTNLPSGPPPPAPAALTNRTDWFYFPTMQDAGDENSFSPQYAYWDAARSHLFFSVRNLNEVLVLDTQKHAIIAALTVISPEGMDIAADGTTLYVGTDSSLLYSVDPATLRVTAMTDTGVPTLRPYTLNTGQLILVPQFGVDDVPDVYLWDSSSATATALNTAGACGGFGFDGAERTRDHSEVFFTSGGHGCGIAIYHAATGAWSSVTFPSNTGLIERGAMNPGRDQVALSDLNGDISVYNAAGTLTGTIIAGGGFGGGTHLDGIVFSADGSRLYALISGDVKSYDTTTWASVASIIQPYSLGAFSSPLPLAADGTGMIYGVNDFGIDFIDAAAAFQPPGGAAAAPQTRFTTFVTPSTGAVAGGTSLQIGVGTEVGAAPPPAQFAVFVGNHAGTNPQDAPGQYTSQYTVTTPPSLQPGPVNVLVQFADDTAILAPLAFSYGPDVTDLVTNAATATGGTGDLFGYGLADAAVSLGGLDTAAHVLPAPESLSPPLPTPLEEVPFQIPAAAAGDADLDVTGPSGAARWPAAFHYYPPGQFHPGSKALQAGVYDAQRDDIYYSDQGQIDVWNITSGAWDAPIPVPRAATAGLVGIALSPSGHWLAAGDQGNRAIVVGHPDDPASFVSYPVTAAGGAGPQVPQGLAISDTGTVYYLAGQPSNGTLGQDISCDGAQFWVLQTPSGNQTHTNPGCTAPQSRVAISPDNAAVYIDAEGDLSVYDTTSGSLTPLTGFENATSDLGLSADGTTLVQNDTVFTPRFDFAPSVPLTASTPFFSQRFGLDVDQDGSLYFQPAANWVDVIDVGAMRLWRRIALDRPLPLVFDSLVWDNGHHHLFAIVAGGIEEIDLDPLPLTLTRTSPGSGPASGANLVTLAGNGFVPGMTATVDGTPAPVTVLDPRTAQIVMPAHAAGEVTLTLTNPGGGSVARQTEYNYETSLPGTTLRSRSRPASIRLWRPRVTVGGGLERPRAEWASPAGSRSPAPE